MRFSPKMWLRVGAALAVTCAGFWLAADSLTFSLAPTDRVAGRARGCYTFTENMLGSKEPSDGVRIGQGVVGLLMGFGTAPAFLFWRQVKHR
jgi:hypothetical protein